MPYRLFTASNIILSIGLFLLIFMATTLLYIELCLPNPQELNTVKLQMPLKIFTADGKLIGIFGSKKRMPIRYEHIPPDLIHAVIATEDQRYFQHPGIDLPGLVRACMQLLLTGRKDQGGSTITMQLARSFYLSPEKTFGRKVREILLALKIESCVSKNKILELYLNKIFLGNRAYGVVAAAELYYGKSLDNLSIDQYAMLAGLPKAPSLLNPLANPEAAIKRRNHVLRRMLELNYITDASYKAALKKPLDARYHEPKIELSAPYVAEWVRNQLEKIYGPSIYTNGLIVTTTIDSKMQEFANHAVSYGLLSYDRRHGYRGPEANWGTSLPEDLHVWSNKLRTVPIINKLEPAVIIAVADFTITVLRANGEQIQLGWQDLQWARKPQLDDANNDILGPAPESAHDIAKIGDLIRIKADYSKQDWHFMQIPAAEASLVVLNPHHGAILALIGGFDYAKSNFNRVTNTSRQTGSSFKPFVYSAALEYGFNLASMINDAPVVIENKSIGQLWRPQNSSRKFYGPTSLRTALVHSRNIVSIKLLEQMGLDKTITYLQKFGFHANQLPYGLSLALGTANISPLQLASAYAVFANGGYRINPYIIKTITDSNGHNIFIAAPEHPCTTNQALSISSCASQVLSSDNAFLINTVLRDVIQHGTAQQAKILNRYDIAGKTGTTQNQHDAWFAGYNNQLVAVSWLGFDQPKSIGEFGNKAALPIWINFMSHALSNQAEQEFMRPDSISTVLIDPHTGSKTDTSNPDAVFEYFSANNLPPDPEPSISDTEGVEVY